MSIQHLTADEFYSAIEGGPVLVDFWAGWCGPCKMLAPLMEELDVEYGDRIKIAKVDVDAVNTVAMEYGIMSIPTVALFKNGQELGRYVGVQPKSVYVDAMGPFLSAPVPQELGEGDGE